MSFGRLALSGRYHAAPPPSPPGWQPIKLGNGGLIIHYDIANDGTMVCATDTMGGYIWDAVQDKWQQLLTMDRFPSSITSQYLNGTNSKGWEDVGFDDIIINKANSNIIWVGYNGDILKSIDKGLTFNTTGFASESILLRSCVGSAKEYAPYSAIDPINSDVAYFSRASRGLFVTTDGGISFSPVTAVSAGLPAAEGNNPSVIPTAGTSATSLAIGTGAKTFTTSSSFGFGATNYVKAWSASNPSKQMLGTVTNNVGTSLVLNVTDPQGSGTVNDWIISGQNFVGAGHRVVFDPSGGTVTVAGQLRTKNIFVHTYGVNTWKGVCDTSGIVTWTAVNQTNMPNRIGKLAIGPTGILWALDDIFIFGTGKSNLNSYSGTTWANNLGVGPTENSSWWNGLAIDPNNTAHVCVLAGRVGKISIDSGANWVSFGDTGNWTMASSGDVDWAKSYFDTTSNQFFSNSCMFDPLVSGKLWIPGEGVWYTTPSAGSPAITITQQSRGIEEFIVNRIISPGGRGGEVFCGLWDFPTLYTNNFNAYPSGTSTALPSLPTQPNALLRGYDFDWLWNDPQTLVSTVLNGSGFGGVTAHNFSGKTTTGGATSASWTKFASIGPLTGPTDGTQIAISAPNVVVAVPFASGSKPQITTDGGTNWADIAVTPSASWGGFDQFAGQSKTIESDKANGDIYIYNINLNDGFGDAIYRMAAGGTTWTQQSRPNFASQSNINEQLISSGVAGHLFFTPGAQGSSFPTNTPFYWSINQGANFNTIANFKQVLAFGFGATFPGQSYPSIYAAGWYSGVYGIYMCKNFNPSTGAGTWTQIGDQFPLKIMAFPRYMDADKVTPGKVYVITNGGAFWGQFS